MPAERLLQRVQVRCRAHAFDRDDVAAVDLAGERQTGARGVAVDQHRAHSADAVLTTDVSAGQSEMVAQRVGERHSRGDVHRRSPAVDGEVDPEQLLRRASQRVGGRVAGVPAADGGSGAVTEPTAGIRGAQQQVGCRHQWLSF